MSQLSSRIKDSSYGARQEQSLAHELRQMDTQGTPEQATHQAEDGIPFNIQDYLERHKVSFNNHNQPGCIQVDSTVNKIVNKVIKERPADPLSKIAMYLLQQSRKSYPTFDKLKARRIFVGDNLQCETIRISVHLNYQGRSAVRYRYNFSFDPEELERILFDDQATKTGLKQGINMIGEAITETLRMNLGSMALDIDAFRRLDGILLQFYE